MKSDEGLVTKPKNRNLENLNVCCVKTVFFNTKFEYSFQMSIVHLEIFQFDRGR